MDVRLAKGVFRFVTGKVARDEPENVNLKLPVGSIGIRGTIGGAQVGDDESVVALLGPGPFNDADERPGGLIVRSPGGSEELVTPGWAVRIAGTGPPSPAFDIGPDFGPPSLGPPGPGPGRPAGRPGLPPHAGPHDPAHAAGAVRMEGRVAGQAPVQVANKAQELEELDPSLLQTPDEMEFAQFVPGAFTSATGFPDGFTKVQDLIQYADIFQGTFRWHQPGVLLELPHTGVFDGELVLDFARQDVTFNFWNFNSLTFLTTAAAPGFSVTKGFHQSQGPNARYQLSGTYLELPSTNCIPCIVTVDAKFLTENNVPAGRGEFVVFISGSGINAKTPLSIGNPEINP